MSFDPSAVKRLVLIAVAIVSTLAVNVGYGLARFSWQGMSPPERLREVQAGAPYFVLGLFLVAVGAILGERLAAGTSPPSRWAGLAAGAGLALVVVVVGLVQGRVDFWLPPNAAMAVVGGWLGSWVAHLVNLRR